MPKQPSSIAVIIVNYGTADLAILAVESVLAQQGVNYTTQIHLVDNDSPEGDRNTLTRTHEKKGWGRRVSLYLETENHGFGSGNNVVLEKLAAQPEPPDYVFLLNPDAQLENDVLSILLARAEADAKLGMIGAGISLPDGKPVTAAFRFPNPVAEFAHAISFGPISRLFSEFTVALPPEQPFGHVDWVSGAAVLIRFETLRDIGFFDPAYFLYFEEVDLMLRARRNGWSTLYEPGARVIHVEGAATDQKSQRQERRRRPQYWYESWSHFYYKNFGRRGAIRAGIAWMGGAALNFPISAVRGRVPQAPAMFYRDFWKVVMWPLLVGGTKSPLRTAAKDE